MKTSLCNLQSAVRNGLLLMIIINSFMSMCLPVLCSAQKHKNTSRQNAWKVIVEPNTGKGNKEVPPNDFNFKVYLTTMNGKNVNPRTFTAKVIITDANGIRIESMPLARIIKDGDGKAGNLSQGRLDRFIAGDLYTCIISVTAPDKTQLKPTVIYMRARKQPSMMDRRIILDINQKNQEARKSNKNIWDRP